ncbi:hypothetical protein VRB49_14380 [Erwinia aphidicola]|uniref:hypothetical protein n=1 Tax=Erwinia aphidicola TaxID=68334 RepID=UPI0030CB21F9
MIVTLGDFSAAVTPLAGQAKEIIAADVVSQFYFANPGVQHFFCIFKVFALIVAMGLILFTDCRESVATAYDITVTVLLQG